jgi:hypothetical protein
LLACDGVGIRKVTILAENNYSIGKRKNFLKERLTFISVLCKLVSGALIALLLPAVQAARSRTANTMFKQDQTNRFCVTQLSRCSR